MHKLTPTGKALALAFVHYHAQFPHKHNPRAWVRHVERMRQSAPPWESVVLSMPADMTASGRTERITIYETLFQPQTSHATNH
jgi:hypothetical protein